MRYVAPFEMKFSPRARAAQAARLLQHLHHLVRLGPPRDDRKTPLMCTAHNDNPEAVKVLIAANARIDAEDKPDRTRGYPDRRQAGSQAEVDTSYYSRQVPLRLYDP
ncbi:hypothetical protein VOLCADRAFT_86543 [Volvox carteri f. nagariensis]|uniref:Uncharacterized protein n=1 Tax=Volvox carteri f. nagariensis TaxID=3068 RepID=D8TIY7_VOLCA|nr:uncharacterized protein VOLCADRAFT_86543 [Volvox carteri f. nagariensis]EFJ52448.1 hypothetical protein VOLCADRAFT_86543 [Volvox carteri f. nagariensis]|eukprot:XP_002946521.1 hypothetical protein VOLCADRAFT_86543 [Volvox carteri f. nagariensis]